MSYFAIELGSNGAVGGTLDETITGGTPDNDVIVPSGNPVILRDGGLDISQITLAKTGLDTAVAPLKVQLPTDTSAGIVIENPSSNYRTRINPSGIFFNGDLISGYTIQMSERTAGTAQALSIVGSPVSGAGRVGGPVRITGGLGTGGATSGPVQIGALGLSGSVEIGHPSTPTAIKGDASVTGVLTVDDGTYKTRVTGVGILEHPDNPDGLYFGGAVVNTIDPNSGNVFAGSASGADGIKGAPVYVHGGHATVGNADGGDTHIYAGVAAGTGAKGNIYIGSYNGNPSAFEMEFAFGFSVQEDATPPLSGSTPGKGQFWVSSATHRPMFRDHLGVDNDLGGFAATVSGAANLNYTGPVGTWAGSQFAFPTEDAITTFGAGTHPALTSAYVGSVSPISGNVRSVAVTYQLTASVDGTLVVYKIGLTDGSATQTMTPLASIDLGAAKTDSSTEWYKDTFSINVAINAGDKIGIFKKHTTVSGNVNASFAALVR